MNQTEKQFRRRLLGVVRWSLLLFCILVLTAGAVSLWRGYGLSSWSERRVDAGLVGAYRGVYIGRGGLRLWHIALQNTATDSVPTHRVDTKWEPDPEYPASNGWGFQWVHEPSGDQSDRILVFPLWLPLLLTAVPAILMFRAHRRASVLPGHCRACGYDLRESPDRCPECGVPAELVA